MRLLREHGLGQNLNRLAVIASILLLLKLFTYIFQEFLPVFGQVLGTAVAAFLPFLLAFVLAFLLEPAVITLMRVLHVRRSYASVVTLVLSLIFIGLILFLIVARLYTELSELSAILPNYEYLASFIQSQVDQIEKFVRVNPQVQTTLYDSAQSILHSIQSWARIASVWILNFLAALPGVFIVMVVSIVATLLVSSSYPGVKKFIQSLFPRRWHTSAHAISQDLGTAIVGFVRAEAILVSVTALITIIGLLLIGNRYAFTLGVLAGILDILPIVGTGVLFVPWSLSLFIMGATEQGLKVLLIWVIAVVVRQSLEPKILSHNIGLHPLPTLISMYAGLKLLGGVGLLLGPALIIVYEAVRKAGAFKGPRD